MVVEIEAAVFPMSEPTPPEAPPAPALVADPPGVVPALGAAPEPLADEVFKDVFFLPAEAFESLKISKINYVSSEGANGMTGGNSYLLSSSVVRPCSASGCGSTFLRMNLSARDAKHLRAPSETCWSSDRRRELRHSTHDGRHSL